MLQSVKFTHCVVQYWCYHWKRKTFAEIGKRFPAIIESTEINLAIIQVGQDRQYLCRIAKSLFICKYLGRLYIREFTVFCNLLLLTTRLRI